MCVESGESAEFWDSLIFSEKSRAKTVTFWLLETLTDGGGFRRNLIEGSKRPPYALSSRDLSVKL
jgi:hypothetical protein